MSLTSLGVIVARKNDIAGMVFSANWMSDGLFGAKFGPPCGGNPWQDAQTFFTICSPLARSARAVVARAGSARAKARATWVDRMNL